MTSATERQVNVAAEYAAWAVEGSDLDLDAVISSIEKEAQRRLDEETHAWRGEPDA